MRGRKPGLVPRARRRRTRSAFPGCQSLARPHLGAVGPSGGTVYTSDLKSAGFLGMKSRWGRFPHYGQDLDSMATSRKAVSLS
jgi:hypothetical protein